MNFGKNGRGGRGGKKSMVRPSTGKGIRKEKGGGHPGLNDKVW